LLSEIIYIVVIVVL